MGRQSQALPPLSSLCPLAVIADKAYDTNAILAHLTDRKVALVIPPKSNRVDQRLYDENLYADRNKIERFRFGDPIQPSEGVPSHRHPL